MYEIYLISLNEMPVILSLSIKECVLISYSRLALSINLFFPTKTNHNAYVIEQSCLRFFFHYTFLDYIILIKQMASSSGVIPDVSPSQVLSVSPSLPTNKLLDNLTVKIFHFNLFFYSILLQKNQRLLQSLPQNYEKKQSFTTLYKTLLDDFFYSHERADVQLYAAICLADVIRIWAPNLPDAPPEKLLVKRKFPFKCSYFSLFFRICFFFLLVNYLD